MAFCDLNITAPDERIDPVAEAAAEGYEPTAAEVDAGIAAWEASIREVAADAWRAALVC